MADILAGIILVGEPATGKYELLSKQGIAVKTLHPLIAEGIGLDIAKYYDLYVDGRKADLILRAVDHTKKSIKDWYIAKAAIATYTAPDDINKQLLQTQLRKLYEISSTTPVAFWPFCETDQEFEKKVSEQFQDKIFLFSHEHPINKRLEDLVRESLLEQVLEG